MNGVLIDTNVLSELTRPQPDTRVEAFLRQVRHDAHVSVLSIGEIRKGISSLPQGSKKTLLEEWLQVEILPWLGDRLLPVTLAIASRWGDLAGQTAITGRTRPAIDLLIAATAIEHGLELATRNTRDYEQLGLAVIDPWTAR